MMTAIVNLAWQVAPTSRPATTTLQPPSMRVASTLTLASTAKAIALTMRMPTAFAMSWTTASARLMPVAFAMAQARSTSVDAKSASAKTSMKMAFATTKTTVSAKLMPVASATAQATSTSADVPTFPLGIAIATAPNLTPLVFVVATAAMIQMRTAFATMWMTALT